MSVALVAVVSGIAYERYAANLFESAFEYFGPDPVVAHVALPGRSGWPDATLYRYHVMLENRRIFDGFDHIFLCDADMRFEAPVGPEILGRLVATEHPGFVRRPAPALPFETDVASQAFVPPNLRRTYYAGGFVGGDREAFLWLALQIVAGIDRDERNGILAVWHDESHLNHVLSANGPSVLLTPSYCYPDDDSGYVKTWPERYERKLVALDKTPVERGGR